METLNTLFTILGVVVTAAALVLGFCAALENYTTRSLRGKVVWLLWVVVGLLVVGVGVEVFFGVYPTQAARQPERVTTMTSYGNSFYTPGSGYICDSTGYCKSSSVTDEKTWTVCNGTAYLSVQVPEGCNQPPSLTTGKLCAQGADVGSCH